MKAWGGGGCFKQCNSKIWYIKKYHGNITAAFINIIGQPIVCGQILLGSTIVWMMPQK